MVSATQGGNTTLASRNWRRGRHLSSARNFVSRGGGGGGSTIPISSSSVISSGFCGAIDALGTVAAPRLGSSNPPSTSSSSIVISSGLFARGEGPDDGCLGSGRSCRTRASKRVCRWAANHHVGWRFRRRPISGGEPSWFDLISSRKNGLRRSRSLRSPCCSIPLGQS